MLGQRDVLRTHLGTGELGLAAPDAVFLFDDAQALLLAVLALALVHREAVGLVDGGGAEILVVAGGDVTRRHARATPDTPRRHLDLLAVLPGLALLFELVVRGLVGVEVRLDGLHLVVEVLHVDDEILHHFLVGQRFDADGVVQVGYLRLAAEALPAVDEQCVRPTDGLPAGVPEGQ